MNPGQQPNGVPVLPSTPDASDRSSRLACEFIAALSAWAWILFVEHPDWKGVTP